MSSDYASPHFRSYFVFNLPALVRIKNKFMRFLFKHQPVFWTIRTIANLYIIIPSILGLSFMFGKNVHICWITVGVELLKHTKWSIYFLSPEWGRNDNSGPQNVAEFRYLGADSNRSTISFSLKYFLFSSPTRNMNYIVWEAGVAVTTFSIQMTHGSTGRISLHQCQSLFLSLLPSVFI